MATELTREDIHRQLEFWKNQPLERRKELLRIWLEGRTARVAKVHGNSGFIDLIMDDLSSYEYGREASP